MAHDLRSFLATIDELGYLDKVNSPVDPLTEIGSLFDQSTKPLLFNHLKGYPGWTACGELLTRRELQAVTLGVTPKEVIGAGFADSFKTDPRAVYPNLLALRAWEADSRLADVSVPTLVVVGADEDTYMAEQADRMTSQIPGASRVVIDAAAHMIPLEQPGPLADAVTAFLEGLA